DEPKTEIDELIDIIQAPDFPTGATIYGLGGVREGYKTGRGRVGRFFDELDDFIDIGQCDGFAFGDMPFMACLLQPEKRTSG
ncbi:hypothetical protein C5B26_13560, partial [Neisseria gonorrhoeae]|uniref:hypothetical protein n=1 Tax=Neisseria gonorrhoeae TaxID=485 RepID=UPI000D4C0AF9